METYSHDTPASAIAVIGMSCRYPRAKTPDEYWKVLRDGIECVTEITEQDLVAAGLNPEVMRHPSYVNRQVVLDDIDLFDADFFGYTPRDAAILDPQQRFMLECAWEAMENAGYSPATCKAVVGIFVGADMSQYLFNLYGNREIIETAGMFAINLANDKDHVSTRVAYKLNLKGPAVTVQTTCSTSLVAICQACQSLLNYQCDIALAGGTAIALPQKVGYIYQEGGIASPDGYCRSFDARAQGTIGGSGTGVVALKRFEEALQDGDQIHAIIRGFGINNDGARKVGYTAPSIEGQAEAIAMAQAMAEVTPDTISYVEAHGTATPLGDPIEIKALSEVFKAQRGQQKFCGIGSVKTNFGHLNSAAGVAGLMKVVLALKNNMIPPSLHFERPNPNIDFDKSPFYVVNKLTPWQPNGHPLRAGVSSFGIGGTNAHVVLEKFVAPPTQRSPRPWQLLLLSAKTPEALEALTAGMETYLKDHRDINIADVAYTLSVGRQYHAHRNALVVATENDTRSEPLPRTSNELANGNLHQTTHKAQSVAFLFSGQGAQYVNMGRALYESEPFFRDQIDHCCAVLENTLHDDLRQWLFPSPDKAAEASHKLAQTQFTQPALFVMEYSLAMLWMHWGIQPQAMAGHSIGEYVAATLASVFSLEDALALVADRGKLMQAMPTGTMLAVHLPEHEVMALLTPTLSLAAVNGPSLCVVAGAPDAIEPFTAVLQNNHIHFSTLKTSHAFHSHLFDPLIPVFADRVKQIKLNPPTKRFLSNKTGTWITPEEATNPNYWAMHLRATVRFADNLRTLFSDGGQILLEVGPGTTLTTLARQLMPEKPATYILSSLPHPSDKQSAARTMLSAVGKLWLEGIEPDWTAFYENEKRQRIALPPYPFQRKRYWVTPDGNNTSQANVARKDISQWFYLPSWEPTPHLSDHTPIPPTAEKWLVFADHPGMAGALTQQLHTTTPEVYTAHAATSFEQQNKYNFTLNPDSKEDYKKLLAVLYNEKAMPSRIVYLWSIIADETIPDTEKHEALYRQYLSMLYLVQSINETAPGWELQILVITQGLYRVEGNERGHALQALATGAAKVASQEFTHIQYRNIDLATDFSDRTRMAEDASRIIREAFAETQEETIALRQTDRWLFQFKEAPPRKVNQNKLRTRPAGVYLITGGLNGIGLELADYLAFQKKARLVLVSRSTFPEKQQWDPWIKEKGRSNAVSKKIARIREWEEAGAKVLVVTADITDRGDVQRLAHTIETRYGRLHGIIHSAGVAGGGIIPLKGAQQAIKVLAPKVKGTLLLQEAFGHTTLDFFVSCSSLSAALGGVGQSDYCAANRFEDAFANHLCGHNKIFYLSINWDTWGEVGMAVDTEVPPEMKAMKEEGLKRGIRNEEGKILFEAMMQSSASQIAISTIDLAARAMPVPTAATHQQESTAAPTRTNTPAKYPRPSVTTEYLAPRSATEEQIGKLWEDLLGIHPIGVNDNFLELGGHSLLAVQLISRVRDLLKKEISIQQFFETPTIAALAKIIQNGQDERGNGSVPNRSSINIAPREQYRSKVNEEGKLELPEGMKKPKRDDSGTT